MILPKRIHQTTYLLLVLNCFCFNQLHGQSNEGTDFWCGFMEHVDINANTKVAMITSKFNTGGTISIPNGTWSESFSVAANQVTIVELPDNTENIGSEIFGEVGIRIQSNDPVSVYIHQYRRYRSEASVVLPVSSIGKEYYALTYKGVFAMGRDHYSEFLLVGTEDETNVRITLSDQTRAGKTAGSTFNFILNKGQTYQVQGATSTSDLTGTHIVGDKDFALFGGNSWTEVPTGCNARDNLLEQMLPVNTWGKKFVSVPNAEVNYDIFRILASEDNTTIEVFETIDNHTYTLNTGEFVEYTQSAPSYIESNNPIQVAQFNVGQDCSGHNIGDPSMVLLNSVEQTRDTVTLYNSSLQEIVENYINIIVATSDVPLITFDGQPIPASAETGVIGQNDEFTYIRLAVNEGAHTIISEACGVIATAYGYGDAESYSYSGGASFNEINSNPIPEGGCLNDTIFFDTKLPESKYSFFWDLGDGNTTNETVFQHFYPDLGSYPVELIITDKCLGTMDTLNRDLLISLRQPLETLGDTLICEGESFQLGATDLADANYEWTGPNGYFSEAQFPFVRNAAPNMSGEYAAIGIISGCATFPSISNVEVIALPAPDLGPDTIFCNNDFQTLLDPGNFSDYLWQDNSTQSTFGVIEDDMFWVEVADQYGCKKADSVSLKQICPTEIFIPNAFSPNFDGINDRFQVYGHDIINMRLMVFDRWGNSLYEGKDQTAFWDGSFRGKPVDPGIYAWVVEIEGYRADGRIYEEVLSGDLTLVR